MERDSLNQFKCVITEIGQLLHNRATKTSIVAEVTVIGPRAMAQHLRAIANELDPPKVHMRGGTLGGIVRGRQTMDKFIADAEQEATDHQSVVLRTKLGELLDDYTTTTTNPEGSYRPIEDNTQA